MSEKAKGTLDASFLLRLPRTLLDEVDAIVLKHNETSKGPSYLAKMTRVSLTRHALERTVREAKRAR
jgi:hypothetical protein